IILATPKQKSKATLHDVYNQEQLRAVLGYLKDNYPNLYLCCLFAYACFIRPHREFRLLTRRNFNDDLSEIHMSGFENKSGRVRVVHVAEYVRIELEKLNVQGLTPDTYLSSRKLIPFNE